MISINAFAYLPGLPLRVPRRLWGKPDSNRQPNVHDVALTSEGLPSYSYFPNMSILIVLFVLETSELHSGLGMNKYKCLTKKIL